jgi:hypothetical protein
MGGEDAGKGSGSPLGAERKHAVDFVKECPGKSPLVWLDCEGSLQFCCAEIVRIAGCTPFK